MPKKIKTMWFYIIIILFVAVMLILVSNVSELNNFKGMETEENATIGKIDKSLSVLTEQNEELNEKLKTTEKEKNENEKSANGKIEAQKKLILATDDFYKEDYEDSYNALKNINTEMLDSECVDIYKDIKNKLNKKGYTFE